MGIVRQGAVSGKGWPRVASAEAQVSVVALPGEAVPGTGGGSYSTYAFDGGGLNDAGDVSFRASVSGGTTTRGLFVVSGGAHSAAALEGGSAPETGGGTYTTVFNPSLSASGDVLFYANVGGGSVMSRSERHRVLSPEVDVRWRHVVKGQVTPGPPYQWDILAQWQTETGPAARSRPSCCCSAPPVATDPNWRANRARGTYS